jgi:ComF family protein
MMVSLLEVLRDNILDPLLALAFPPLCPVCGGSLSPSQKGLCSDCARLLAAATISPDSLYKLRRSLPRAGGLDDALVLFYFDRESPLQALIHRLKYHGGRSVGRELGARLGMLLARELPAGESRGIIPVPLHRARRRHRGYNQAFLVAEGIQSILMLPILDDLLKRTRPTVSQTGLTAPARSRNVAGAFAVDSQKRESVSGASFLIVDDVLTTGATLDACARALKAAGASRCTGATVAMTR